MYKAAGAITDEELLTFREFGSRAWRATRRRSSRGSTSPPARSARGCRSRVGIALAGKQLDRLPYRVWVLCGDSEMAEGSMWEAFEHAASYEARQPDRDHRREPARPARRDDARLGPRLLRRAGREAFGWHAIEIDGHDVEAIDRAYAEATAADGQPTVIVAHTIKGKGVTAVENKHGWHGKALDRPRRRRSRSSAASATCVVAPAGARGQRPSRTGSRPTTVELPTYERRREGRDPHGLRRRAGRARRGDAATSSRSTARSRNSTYAGDLPRRPPRPLLRDVHRRAADGRGGGRHAGARLGAVRVDLRGLPRAAPTTSSAWPRSARRTSASAARTPASRSARTARRRWRSRTSR